MGVKKGVKRLYESHSFLSEVDVFNNISVKGVRSGLKFVCEGHHFEVTLSF
jgi:hypothetical protein